MFVKQLFINLFLMLLGMSFVAFGQRTKEYKIYQFPKNEIPRIDGKFQDWESVPESYLIGLDQLKETIKVGVDVDSKDFNIEVKVAWVKNLNRLYFYVEAYDDYWDFNDKGLKQDIFEVVLDGNLSGGPFINKYNGNIDRFTFEDLYFKGHGAHAQNYHVFTPVINKEPAMIWGNTPWIKEFPYFNIAYDYNFKHGESGKLKMEFWITPFDHADIDGIDRSTVTKLKENDVIGLSWCVLDYDNSPKFESFINLAHDTKMIYDATFLNLFKLMPLENEDKKKLDVNWSFVEMDRVTRWIQFKDESIGNVENWNWDFGDGTTSNEKNPIHIYTKPGAWTVVLTIDNPIEQSIKSKVREVVTE